MLLFVKLEVLSGVFFMFSKFYKLYQIAESIIFIIGENPFEESSKRSDSSVSYGTKEAQVLTENLSRKQMPGLTSQEQMYLLALSDTVASTTYDIEATTSNFTTKHMIGNPMYYKLIHTFIYM